ncbi:MAG: AEC family transporter [Actinomycetota bacterium]
MDTVQLLIDVLGPVVLIVAVGAVVGPRIGLEVPTLSKIAYWIFGPAFVFNIFATTTLEADTAIRLVLAGMGGLAVSALLSTALAPAFGLRGAAASATIMSSTYGNVGNAGLAICVFALGDDALDRAGVLMVTIMFFGTLLSVWLGTRQHQSSVAALAQAFRAPMIVAAIVGLAINLVDIDPPVIVDRTVATIASGLIPTMLVSLGIQLVEVGRVRWLRSTSVVTIAKLAAAPIAGWLVAEALGLAGDDRGVVILQSAMPPAVFCMVIAIEHDLEAERATNDVVAVTLAALISLPIALTFAV